jgi:ArsR family transcriptional regulator
VSIVDTILVPKHKRSPGAPPVVSPARPSLDAERAARLATYAKALADPIRVQLVDVLAEHPGELCACELLPLFDVAQSTLSHHLKTLADASILETRRQGLFAYYIVRPRALADLAGWLDHAAQAGAQS